MLKSSFLDTNNTFRLLLLCFFSLVLSSCDTPKAIINDIAEKEANEIIVFLSSKGISSDKKAMVASGGGGNKQTLYQIIVSENEATRAMAILNRYGFPRRKGQTLLGLFANSGLVPSEMEEKIRFTSGLEEQLANTIRKIDGVIDADVQLSIPSDQSLIPGQDKELTTASVYVKHQGIFDDPNSHLDSKIKRWVASSVNGLEFDNVTVIADRARYIDTSGNAANASAASAAPQLVTIWSVLIAKTSVKRFQTLFFTLSLSLLLSLIVIAWLVWKLLPLLKDSGVKPFLSLEPLAFAAIAATTVATAKDDDEAEESDAKETADEEANKEEDDDEWEEDEEDKDK